MADAVRVADSAALSQYIEGIFAVEDEVLRELRAAIVDAGMPQIHISPEAGRLLQVLLAASGAWRVVEIGTLGGYSAIWMARALPSGGAVLTLEREPEHAALARRFITRAGLGDRIEVREGDAHATLRALREAGERFDACFIDAEKSGYADYLEQALALVHPGGLILADNVLWGGDVLEARDEGDPVGAEDEGAGGVSARAVDIGAESNEAGEDLAAARAADTRRIHAFNRALATNPSLLATIIPVRDGIAVAVRLPPES